jgi:hypothetical protein
LLISRFGLEVPETIGKPLAIAASWEIAYYHRDFYQNRMHKVEAESFCWSSAYLGVLAHEIQGESCCLSSAFLVVLAPSGTSLHGKKSMRTVSGVVVDSLLQACKMESNGGGMVARATAPTALMAAAPGGRFQWRTALI